jgi:hypothetical protein
MAVDPETGNLFAMSNADLIAYGPEGRMTAQSELPSRSGGTMAWHEGRLVVMPGSRACSSTGSRLPRSISAAIDLWE